METELIKILAKIKTLPKPQSLIGLTRQLLYQSKNDTNYQKWQNALDKIAQITPGELSVERGCIKIDLPHTPRTLGEHLAAFTPWRKGPYQIGSLVLDSEWCGDMKWARLQPHTQNLAGKNILDVGCGNGYFLYLMALSGARAVWGLEPFLLFNYQFYALAKLIKTPLPLTILPIRLELLSTEGYFDTVFSMGVIYHQKSAIEHLLQLRRQLKSGGELILETLIVEGDLGYQLLPKSRYAQMPNVWFVPSVPTMVNYLERCGFTQINCVNISQTSTVEQHKTPWLGKKPQSLVDFLDAQNSDLTIEGYPAPRRAIFICKKDTR